MNAVRTIVYAALACCAFVFSGAFAESVEIEGGEVTYTGAEMSRVGDDLVLVYRNPSVPGTFSFAGNATARILVVGGGGAGGSIGTRAEPARPGQPKPKPDDLGLAGGGGGGGVTDRAVTLKAGAYRVTVGAGGRRAQSAVSSWTGSEGGMTLLEREIPPAAPAESAEEDVPAEPAAPSYEIVFSSVGGGGGGVAKAGGVGMAGGSGGGGSWYHVAVPGGTGVEGFGWDGGTPANADAGGGGGGGSAVRAEGRGKPDGTPGAGRTSDITGEDVVYAQGGRGGRRGPDYTPGDGAGYGFGGDGAATGFGGSGADGVLIVRISHLFTYKKVAFPDYLRQTVFEPDTTFTAFDLAQQPEEFRAAVKSVTGEYQVTTKTRETDADSGLGIHTFQITLNDEYLWDIGEDGSDSPFEATWRILDQETYALANVDIRKAVTWNQGERARISIDVHMSPQLTYRKPKILVLGSLCGVHGLKSDVVTAAINSCATAGDVDYFFFERITAGDSNMTRDAHFRGSLRQGESIPAQTIQCRHDDGDAATRLRPLEEVGGNHTVLYGFYREIWNAMQRGDFYDFIVLSFDRTLVAVRNLPIHEHEAEVSAYMKTRYEKGGVIWLVDNGYKNFPNNPDDVLEQDPWVPSPVVSAWDKNYDLKDDRTTLWRTMDWYCWYYYPEEARAGNWAYRNFNALMGMFSPRHYPVDKTEYRKLSAGISANLSDEVVDRYFGGYYSNLQGSAARAAHDAFKGDPNPNQTVYDNAQNVSELIHRVVVPTDFTAELLDKVRSEMGLEVRASAGQWTVDPPGNESARTWKDLKPEELSVGVTGVRVNLTGVTQDVWLKLFIDVDDNGKFLNNQNAKYNERTGKWEKDPNDGPVEVRMTPMGQDTILAKAEATTAVSWTFETCTIKARVKTGPETGSVVINGQSVPALEVSQGYSPEVAFAGQAGYVLTYLEVDGEEVTDFDPSMTSWIFEKVRVDHEIVVGFEKVEFKLLRAKQRYPWNNLVDIDYFIGGGDVENAGAVYGRLAFFVEYTGDDGRRVKKQLRTFRDNAKIRYNGPSADAAQAWPEGDDPILLEARADLRTPGYHRVTWDANADGVAIFEKKGVTFTLVACEAN